MAEQNWSDALRSYIHAQQLTKVAVAKALGVWPSQVLDWCRGGRPRDAAVLIAIQKWSDGAVRADLPAKTLDVETAKAAAR